MTNETISFIGAVLAGALLSLWGVFTWLGRREKAEDAGRALMVDDPGGMFACERCGQPTWYDACDDCYVPATERCGHGGDYRDERGVCQARGCVG